MKCEEARTRILEDADAARDELDAHLARCDVCRGFAGMYREILDAPVTVGPSRALDRAVLDSVGQRLRGSRSPVADAPLRPPWPVGRVLAVAAAMVFVAVVVALLLLGVQSGPQTRVIARPDPAVAVPAWEDGDLELGLMSLEAELGLAAGEGSELADAGGTETGADGTTDSPASIDDAILQLELDLYFENEGLQLEPSERRNGAG